jgi:hypothetical protein
MNEKYKSESPSAILMKNWRKTIGMEEKLDITSWLEKGEHIFDICHYIRLADSSLCTISVNADTITEVLSQ